MCRLINLLHGVLIAAHSEIEAPYEAPFLILIKTQNLVYERNEISQVIWLVTYN